LCALVSTWPAPSTMPEPAPHRCPMPTTEAPAPSASCLMLAPLSSRIVIAANTLSDRLKRLERDGLLVARLYSQRPPRTAYQLTAEGTELAGALRLLAHWGSRHTDQADSPRHLACGTPIEVRWYCPTCDQLVDHEQDHTQLHFV